MNDLKKKSNTTLICVVIAILLISVIAIIAVIRSKSNSSGNRLQDQLDLGYRYLSEFNYEQAVAAFEAAIEIDPNCAEAYLGAADAYIGLGDNDKAIELLQRGFDITGDERLKDKISDLKNEEEPVTDASEANVPENEVKGVTQDKLNEIYEAISEVWDYDVRGGAFDQWDVDTISEYIQTNSTEYQGDGNYFLESGCSASIIDYEGSPLVQIFVDSYVYHYGYINGRKHAEIHCYGNFDKYPIFGMSFVEFLEKHDVTIEELLLNGQRYEDSNQYLFLIDYNRYFFVDVKDEETFECSIVAYDKNRNYRSLEIYSDNNVLSGAGLFEDL